jgi:DNA-binding beta-propeller fold protein YncE
VLYAGSESGHSPRLYLQDTNGGEPKAISPEGYRLLPSGSAVSPDGRSAIAIGTDGQPIVYPLDGGEPRPIPGLAAGAQATSWTGDGGAVYVYQPGQLPARVYRLDVTTGRKELWRELMPSNPAGVFFIRPPHISSDGKSYAYNYRRTLSELFLADGLK